MVPEVTQSETEVAQGRLNKRQLERSVDEDSRAGASKPLVGFEAVSGLLGHQLAMRGVQPFNQLVFQLETFFQYFAQTRQVF